MTFFRRDVSLWLLLATGATFFFLSTASHGQNASTPPPPTQETAEEKKERIAAERFLQLLKRRPRLGTALDRIYGYHVGRGSLDDFSQSLASEASENQDGNIWLILGMIQMQRGQDALAAASLENAEALLPEQPLASYYLGKTLVLLGEVDRAADAMRRAIQRKPARADMLAIFQDLGRIYQRTGRNQEALDVWKQLESLFPGDAQVQEEIASILAEEGALQAALDRYTSLSGTLKDRFRQIEMAIRAAQLKAQLGKTDEALDDFEKQLAVVNPDSWLHRDVRRRIEEVFWASGDIDGLVAYYTKWVKDHPEDVDAMMRTARVLSVQRRMPEAEKWFRDAIAKAPSSTEPRLALVEALVAEDRYDQAAKEMEALVKLQPDNPDYLVRWGELVFNDSKRTEAQRQAESNEIWRGMLRKRGDDPVTVARVADLLRGSGSSEPAIQQYKKAIALAPNEPQYREYLGEYLHQLGRKEEALATWQELAAGPRQTRDNLVRLSEVLSTFRYPDDALAAIAKACEMKPTFGHRARYAELLREAKQYDQALAQLDLAEPLAEDPELRELVIEERIKNYQASGTLAQRIEQAENDVAGSQSGDGKAWRLLALLRDADRKFQLACDAIDNATELDPGSPFIWETAATIQERSGRFGDAIQSYRKLATLDRRFLSNYLTQIASLEMRLGNTDAALKTGEELIASAPGNSEHYRFFADLCFRVAQSDRGFDVLRRNVRSNPNDQDALLYLARMLADDFQTDEAIELYWRGFELAKDIDAKAAVIAPLAELYLRTNRFDSLVDRLEMTGREQNKPRDGLLWAAAAHQAAGDLGMAKQMLEQLAREDSRDTKLLEQLVSLSRTEYDFESAAEYQKRLVAVAPTPKNEYLLGNILLELGEIDQAEALWLKLSQRKNDPSALADSISTLVQKEQLATAVVLIEKAMSSEPGNWEVLAQAMIVYAKLGKKEHVRRIADRVLAMSIDLATPTAKVKQQIEKRASRRNQDINRYDPYANLGERSRLMQVAPQIKATLAPDSNTGRYVGSGQRIFTPSCFQDVQALAYAMPLVAKEEGFKEADFVQQFGRKAIDTNVPEQLWQAIFYALWQDPGVQYGQTQNEMFDKCLRALVEHQQPVAAGVLLGQMINGRQRRSNGNTTQLPPLTEEELAQAKSWSELASKANRQYANYYAPWVAGELSRAGKEEDAEALLDQYVESAKSSPNASMVMMQAMSMLLNERYNKTPSPRMIQKGRELFKASLGGLQLSKTGTNRGIGQQFGGLIDQLVKQDQLEEAVGTVDEVLKWQAEQTAGLRPSQRDRLQSSSGPLSYGKVVNNRYVQTTIAFPPTSGYFGAESIFTLYGLYEACKDDQPKLQQATEYVNRLTETASDDPYLNLVRTIAKAAFAYWANDHDATATILTEASDLQLGGQFIELARTRLLYESGKVRDALEVVEKLRPTNQRMLVDRELTILQLVLQLGDLERAKKSAQKLFALRLDSNTEFKLADLMYQLGMRDLGDRMMGRIRRRAGGKQDTLVQLMTRYVDSGDNDAAAEIARQVIRRTSPRGTQNYYTSENQQHEQAVRILAQTKRLEPLIEQYEKLVQRSPKSTKLVDKLAAFYEAAGRREDAQQLRLKAAEDAPEDPRSLLAAGKQLAKLRKHDQAVEKYIAAVVKSPEILNRNFYEMRSSFNEAKAWNRLADAIVDEGVRKFAQSYRLSSLCSELAQQKDDAAINRILLAALTELQWNELTQIMYSFARSTFKPSDEIIQLLGEKLTSEDASLANFSRNAYVWSRSSNGETTGFVNGIAGIVTSDQALKQRVAENMSTRLEKDEKLLFPRVLLALVQAASKDFRGMRSTVAPLIAKKEKTYDDAQAIWCLASMLTHNAKQPAIACELLESVTNDELWQSSGSDFQFTSTALLAYSYERAKRFTDARRILLEKLKTQEVDQRQNQYNPGYGEYQYINSLSGLARRFLQMGYPAEAFIAFRKAYADESMLTKAKRWGGDMARQRDSLSKEISEKTDAETILNIVKASVGSTDGSPADGESFDDVAVFLTEPQVQRNSLIDTRVTMPLEEFTPKIAEDNVLREAVSRWLKETPLPADPSSLPLKALVTRLLISDSVNDEDEIAATSLAIGKWVSAQEPAKPSEGDSNGKSQPSADASQETDQGKVAQAKMLPEELLLGMAALRMPETTVDNADVVRMLQRAVVVAQANREVALAGSLQCQVAKRVAESDPERARKIFMQALDQVLPADETAAGKSKEEGKS